MKKLVLYIFFAFAAIFSVYGQQGCFTTDASKGCVPLKVNLTYCSILSKVGGVSYDYDYHYEDINFLPLSKLTSDTSHTYNQVGSYRILQIIYHGGNTDTVTSVVNVLPNPSPVFQLGVCDNRQIKINITDNTYDKYIINYGESGYPDDTVLAGSVITHTYPDIITRTITVKGAYLPTWCGNSSSQNVTPINAVIQPDFYKVSVNSQSTNGRLTLTFDAYSDQRYIIQQSNNGTSSYSNIDTLSNLSGTQNYTISNLNTENNQYCFKIISFDDCGNTKTSPEICSISAFANAINNENDISWIPSYNGGNVSNYQVYKDQNPFPVITTTSFSYQDLNVNCAVKYCYQIVTNLNQTNLSGAPLQSVSAIQCVTAISNTTPLAVQNLNSIISINSVALSWDKPSAGVKVLNIQRSVNGGSFNNYATSKINSYIDNGVSIPGNSYCYQIQYTDSCNNTSPISSTTCPCILSASVEPNNSFQNILSWTPYTGSNSAQRYVIEKLDQNNQVIDTISAGNSFSYTDNISGSSVQTIIYRIKVIGTSNNAISYSNEVEIKYEGAVYLPSAFTPNGDGNNDIFSPNGRFIKDFRMTIYNRWGEVVYETEEFNQGWNGVYQGTPATPDAYAYLVQATDFWGKKITERGSVTLLR